MNKLSRLVAWPLSVAFLLGVSILRAQTPAVMELPKPETTGGKPLMQCLKDRKTTRSFAPQELPPQVLSNLLWAAFGVNRPNTGQRTAPSAVNWQEIDIYVAMKSGLYLFNPRAHSLKQLAKDDIRPSIGLQDFVRTAPVVLIYVADFDRMGEAKPEDKIFYSAADTGFISQNVYLFSASENLATVVVGLINRPELTPKLNLRKEQRILLVQPVGYPGK